MHALDYLAVSCLLVFSVACIETPSETQTPDQIVDTPSESVIPKRPQEIEVLDLTEDVALYVVIAGAYSSKEGALKKAGTLKELGYTNADIIQRSGSKLYSALVERFDSEAAAEAFATEIRMNKEIKSYVYKLNE